MSEKPKYADRGKRLFEFFKARAYKSKRAFADLVNTSEQNLNKYFEGYLDPLNLAEGLTKLDVNLHWLSSGIGNMSAFTVMEHSAQVQENQQLKARIAQLESQLEKIVGFQENHIEMVKGELEQTRRMLASETLRTVRSGANQWGRGAAPGKRKL